MKISLETNISKQILKTTISKCLFLGGRIFSVLFIYLFFCFVHFPRLSTNHVYILYKENKKINSLNNSNSLY